MLSRRTAAIVFGGCLTFGGVAATAGSAFAVDTSPTTAASTPAPSAPVPYSLTIPGVGTLSLSLDPTTGAVSNVLVTPADGLTAGAPQISPDGVKISLTAKDGTVHVLQATVEKGEHGLRVEAEVDTDNGEQHQDGVQGTSHENDHKGPTGQIQDHNGDHHDAVSTTDSPTPTSTSTPEGDRHGAESHSNPGSDRHGNDGSGHDATPASTPGSGE